MMTNRKPLVSVHDDPLILVCADLQIEYLTEGRRHVIADADAITSRCLELLTLWRNNLWPVMHLKRIAQAAWFNPASNLTDWIAELKPRPGGLAFEHPRPSAYSSPRVAQYMSNLKKIACRLPGCAGGWVSTMPLHTNRRSSGSSATLPGSRKAPTWSEQAARLPYDQDRIHRLGASVTWRAVRRIRSWCADRWDRRKVLASAGAMMPRGSPTFSTRGKRRAKSIGVY